MKNELVELKKETALVAFTQDTGLDSYVKQVADEVAAFDHDMKTAASRGRTIALARKVAKIKVKYDDCGKDLVSDWKVKAKKVDAARKKMRDELDALKVLARKPVTDWEAEQAEIEQQRLAKVEADKLAAEKLNDHEVAVLLDEKFDRDLADAKAKAEADKKTEDQRLENVRIENETRIANAAKLEAETLAKKAIDDANTEKQKAIDDKAAADKELLESEARTKLLQEQADQERLNNEWVAYISEAYEINSKIDQANHAKLISQQAEAKRLADVEEAKQQEIKRQSDEAESLRLAQAKLEANKKHVGAIRGEIKQYLMSEVGIDEITARNVVLALLKADRITINYGEVKQHEAAA